MENSEKEHVEPGAARFGNFPDYYRFNPADERMKYLAGISKSSLPFITGSKSVECIDIGCNTGELTVQLYEWCRNLLDDEEAKIKMTGLDIDGNLIERATTMFKDKYPNVQFRNTNVMVDGLQLEVFEEIPRVIFCFSVTLWIHLNHGDEGLKTFLKMLADSCDYLIIEPQPWKCYRTAVRRAKRANQKPFEHYDELKIRGTDGPTDFIQSYLVETCGMTKIVHAGTTQWSREIWLFSKR